jgi:exopolysaccharide production protein ExoZ
MTSTANTTSTLQSIQLLRGIAALSVVYVHVLAPPNFGLFGVDIFFVISGFVMALVTTKNTNPTTFFLNRLIRIVPLYWILTTCLVAVILIAPNLLGSTTLNLANFLKSLFFIPYFKESHLIQPFLFVGWTLNYEMLFYLCIATGLMLSSRHYLAIAISALVLIYLMLGLLADSPLLNGFFGNLKIFEFVLGIFAFKIYRLGYLKNIPYLFGFLISASCLLFMIYAEIKQIKIDSFFLYGIPSFFLLLSAISLESLMDSPVVKTISTFVGDTSYAIYLSHAFVIEFIRKVVMKHVDFLQHYMSIVIIISLSASILVGYILHRFLDLPLQHYFKRTLLQRGSSAR